MAIRTGNELGIQVCEALGLDPNTIHTVQLRMNVYEVAELTTIGYVHGGPCDDVGLDELHRYFLVERADWPPPQGPPTPDPFRFLA